MLFLRSSGLDLGDCDGHVVLWGRASERSRFIAEVVTGS